MGIAACRCAMIASINFESQYSLSCSRPFARQVWPPSSKFQRGSFFSFRAALWLEAFVLASMASERTALESTTLIFVTSSTVPPAVGATKAHVPHESNANCQTSGFPDACTRRFKRLFAEALFYAAFRPLFRLGGRWSASIPSDTALPCQEKLLTPYRTTGFRLGSDKGVRCSHSPSGILRRKPGLT